MIPTKSKTKIPHRWSYPIGAELVSQTLKGIPQYDNIYLSFLWINPASRLAHHDKSKLHLLTIAYTNPEQIAINENWSVNVSAVPSELKMSVRDYFQTEIFARVRAWMIAKKPNSWYQSGKILNVALNFDDEKIEYQAWEAA